MPDHDRSGGKGLPPGQKPRLLFLAHRLPYPPDSGVSIRAYHLLRILSRAYEVTLIAFHRVGSTASRERLDHHVAMLRTMVMDIEVFPIPQEHSGCRWLLDHGSSLLSRRPYTEFVYASSQFREAIVTHLRRTSFDIVHMDSMDLVRYLPLLEALPVVCGHHNVESALLQRRAEMEPRKVKAAYLRLQARWIQNAERTWCPKVALNIVVSDGDLRQLKALAPASSFALIPNGVDDSVMRPQGSGANGLVFVGGTTWFPNRDALEYFASEVLPRVHAREGVVPVVWVGRAGEEEQARYRQRGITFTGYVDDIRSYVGEAACFVVPLRVGGGTRLKILDAWAMGKAVVSTRIGAEGLEALDDENILLRDDPQEFADAIIELLHNHALRARLGQAGRATVEKSYAWNSFADAMLASYADVRGARKDPPPRRPIFVAKMGASVRPPASLGEPPEGRLDGDPRP